jgi:diguanylate cyclase (GGDEF)-like protein
MYFLLLFYLIPVIFDNRYSSEEIIWLIYIFPAVLIPFYYGKKGGILAAVVGTLIHLLHEYIEIFIEHKVYNITYIWYMFLITIINLTVALIIGILVEKLKKEQLSLQKAITKMEFMAFHDNLTGLPNRWYFETSLRGALEEAQQKNKLIAVLFMDLDRFKLINDGLGHQTGDKLLKDVAKRLTGNLKSGEFLARQGGDEFILFLTDILSKEQVEMRAAAIHQLLLAPFYIHNNELLLSSSIGISLFPTDGSTWEELIQHADIAMYSAKESGKNGFQFYDTAELQKINDVVKIEGQLRKALVHNEFTLDYQPLIDLISKRIIGMEALIRWKNPELGIIPPSEFIPLAEEIGVIGQLGEWVLKEACTQTKMISDNTGIPIRVAVNISSIQFQDKHFVDIVHRVLKETGLIPNQLELEITESVSLENVEEVIVKLNSLKKLGITIAIDDFGTGYSSISYLKHLPIDTLKIDQSFVRNMLNNSKDKALVESVISLSKSFGFNVTAEGVETLEQLELLTAFDCGQAQGYYFSRPVSINDIYHVLKKNKEKELFIPSFV